MSQKERLIEVAGNEQLVKEDKTYQNKPVDVSKFTAMPEGTVEEAAAILAGLQLDPKALSCVEGMLDTLRDMKKKPTETLVKMDTKSISKEEEPKVDTTSEVKESAVDTDAKVAEYVKKMKKQLNNKEYLDKLKEAGEIIPDQMLMWMSVEALAYYYGKTLDYANACLDSWLMGEPVRETITYKSPGKTSLNVTFSVKDPLTTSSRQLELQKRLNELKDSQKEVWKETLSTLMDIIVDIDAISRDTAEGQASSFTTLADIIAVFASLPSPLVKRIKEDIIKLKIFYLVLAKHPGAYVSFS